MENKVLPILGTQLAVFRMDSGRGFTHLGGRRGDFALQLVVGWTNSLKKMRTVKMGSSFPSNSGENKKQIGEIENTQFWSF